MYNNIIYYSILFIWVIACSIRKVRIICYILYSRHSSLIVYTAISNTELYRASLTAITKLTSLTSLTAAELLTPLSKMLG